MKIKRNDVFKLWKRKGYSIPKIKMFDKDYGCYGEIWWKNELMGSGNICSKYSHALSSAKRWRVILMARTLFPKQWVKIL